MRVFNSVSSIVVVSVYRNSSQIVQVNIVQVNIVQVQVFENVLFMLAQYLIE